jgi:hypothetical protein
MAPVVVWPEGVQRREQTLKAPRHVVNTGNGIGWARAYPELRIPADRGQTLKKFTRRTVGSCRVVAGVKEQNPALLESHEKL